MTRLRRRACSGALVSSSIRRRGSIRRRPGPNSRTRGPSARGQLPSRRPRGPLPLRPGHLRSARLLSPDSRPGRPRIDTAPNGAVGEAPRGPLPPVATDALRDPRRTFAGAAAGLVFAASFGADLPPTFFTTTAARIPAELPPAGVSAIEPEGMATGAGAPLTRGRAQLPRRPGASPTEGYGPRCRASGARSDP